MNIKELVKDAQAQIKSCTEFAVTEIKHICKTIGPRPCGEEPEKKAQEYIMEKLKGFADTVKRETYSVHPTAFMAFVPIAGACLLATTACNFIGAALAKPALSIASVGLVGVALAGTVAEFGMYKKFLDPLFKKKESGNVVASRNASGETKRRIILSGHTDSAPEWTYTYKFGSKGVVSVVGYALVGLAFSLVSSVLLMTISSAVAIKALCWLQLLFVPAYVMLFFFTNNKRFVPGANDDLTGSFIAASVLKFLSDNDIRFENTEVMAVLAGGEEAGLRGSKAFFEAHPELKNDGVETVFVSFDTIRDSEYMMIYNRDMTGFVKNDEKACSLVKNAAAKCGFDVPVGAIPLGSTDAAAASQAGIKAASFVAMDPAPARYYHTRLDTEENLVPETFESVLEIALETVFSFDENGLG